MGGFKQFLMRGNVVDMAVGIVIGAAFGSVVTAFVKDLLTPMNAAIVGKPDFSKITFEIHHSKFPVGDFVNAIVSFDAGQANWRLTGSPDSNGNLGGSVSDDLGLVWGCHATHSADAVRVLRPLLFDGLFYLFNCLRRRWLDGDHDAGGRPTRLAGSLAAGRGFLSLVQYHSQP